MIAIENLLTDDVLWAYSGKVGHCCCGCAGKYSYNSKNRTLGMERGYHITDADVNDTEVKRTLQLMQECSAAVWKIAHDQWTLKIGDSLYMLMSL
jgi:hypothetical protein